jgi:hypothetical protein
LRPEFAYRTSRRFDAHWSSQNQLDLDLQAITGIAQPPFRKRSEQCFELHV